LNLYDYEVLVYMGRSQRILSFYIIYNVFYHANKYTGIRSFFKKK
jgi:hypothetical protein